MARGHRDIARLAANNMLEAANSARPALSRVAKARHGQASSPYRTRHIGEKRFAEPCSTSKLLCWVK